jgi:hypothetical protein
VNAEAVWEVAAWEVMRRDLRGARWSKGSVRVGSGRYERILTSYEALLGHFLDRASREWLTLVPWEDGEPVFPFDAGLVDAALASPQAQGGIRFAFGR